MDYFRRETMISYMKKWLLVLILPVLLAACKGKEKKLSDDDIIEVGDFLNLFNTLTLPVQMADSSFHKKGKDSTIKYAVFTRFVPDSVISKVFGKGVKPVIHPVGKIAVKKQETYLFLKAVTSSKNAGLVAVFDKDNKFSAAMPLIVQDKDVTSTQTAVMDTKLTISTNRQRKNASGQVIYQRSAYVYNDAGIFTLILTESNDVAATRNVLINPIDTLPRHNKLSGDYIRDKMNLVSIRDAKSPSEFLFFIHFEQDGGTCKGELKGKAKIISPTKAVYHQPGDQCEVQFTFSGKTVTINEESGCGSHRDIKCFFEGSFWKRAEIKPKKK